MHKGVLIVSLFFVLVSCATPAERAAKGLARRVVPEFAGKIEFKETADTVESYSIEARGRKLLVRGSGANAMAAGLGRYLRDVCGVDVSWERCHPVESSGLFVLPDSTITSHALVQRRFFLNYCTFGYTMPWWKWEDWERFIDWMALQGINMPLALTGQESVLQELWRRHGMSDEEILSWFTGPAHLPWHRMCNIDGVDGPLPQGWAEGQEELQKRILKRERSLGMHPVLPAFSGHVPAQLKDKHPDAQITRIKGWCGFREEHRPFFLSPQDSLFGALQKEYLEIQSAKYGTDHLYGFDLFNEIEPPCWDSGTLSEISRGAYESIAAADSEAVWVQMGWMFWNDRRHWTPELIESYLGAVPEGKVVILDYYTEAVPVWTLTEGFYGQPFIFCYLGNFGGNTRLAGPFRKESVRITEALDSGADGIGCTLEGFGVNRWIYEYVMARAWSGIQQDDDWLASLDRRRQSPAGFWRHMADSVYLRGSFSEDPLLCGRPCMESYHHWTVIHTTPYDNAHLVEAWKSLLDAPASSAAWRYDAVNIGCQALGNHFAVLRDSFAEAYNSGNLQAAEESAALMLKLLADIDSLAACEPSFSTKAWLDAAESWGSRHNAWQMLTVWAYTPVLNDYASRVWSGLVKEYYARRWSMFLDEALACLREGRDYSQASFDEKCRIWELTSAETAPELEGTAAPEDLPAFCNCLYSRWFGPQS